MSERIAVTGLGAVSALGLSVGANWTAARDGRSGIKPHLLDPGQYGPAPWTQPVALIEEDAVPALEAALGRRVGASLDLFSVFALKAAHEALAQAGLVGAPLGPRSGAVLGNSIGGVRTLEKAYERFYGLRSGKIHPLTVPRLMGSAAVSAIAMEFGVTGPVFTTSSACSSSGHAIAQGAMLIQAGMADMVVVGGTEGMCAPGGIRVWEGLQAMSETACRPFSAGRDGMVAGDGAAALVIERESTAAARGARPIAYLAGAGQSSDAFHWTQPALEGAVSAIRQAVDAAGLLADEEVLISTHGTGTPLNDKNEADAIGVVFGEKGRRHPVIATKSAHGHLIGASTALQAVLAIRALEEGLAPPILNYLGPDEEIALDLVLGEARPIAARATLVNAFAFGGLNVSLAFRLP
ncbi:MAG TPA: beta-ketoacyl-[acyl-carrier-protein] synthase family protein [Caulobacteraceae bacterium]|nr:beta-ketoacyl-[acyl-carrier-protein] synthase family protein [Caulobacteraceae bacterium]